MKPTVYMTGLISMTGIMHPLIRSARGLKLRVVAVCLALLCSQIVVANHGAEHPFHESDSACEQFLAAESAGPLISDVDQGKLHEAINPRMLGRPSPVSVPNTKYLSLPARAPPSYLYT